LFSNNAQKEQDMNNHRCQPVEKRHSSGLSSEGAK